MEHINTFTLEGNDIEILYKNGFLAYSFEYKKKPYGQKVKVKSKSVMDITSATFLLIENAMETYKQLKKQK